MIVFVTKCYWDFEMFYFMFYFVDETFDETIFEISNINVNQIIHDVIMKIIIFVFEIFSQFFIFNAKKNINDFRSVNET